MAAMDRSQLRAYLSELRPYLIASLAIFTLGGLFGALAASRFPALSDHFGEAIGGFLKAFRALPKPQLAAAIFVNNSVKTLAALLLGLGFGVLPAIFLAANGAVLGLVAYLSIHRHGIWTLLLGILPHGLIELTAVFLGTAAGLLLGDCVLKKLTRKSETNIKAELARALRLFTWVILPMLLVAALIEAFVTTALMRV